MSCVSDSVLDVCCPTEFRTTTSWGGHHLGRIVIYPDCHKCLCFKFYVLGGSRRWQNFGGEPNHSPKIMQDEREVIHPHI